MSSDIFVPGDLGGEGDGDYPKNQTEGVRDLCSLIYLEEPNVLDNLASRYTMDKIYTYMAGRVLVAVNPYQWLPIYAPDSVELYKDTSRFEREQLEPHVFAVSESAYQSLSRTQVNQSLIVCGESGSGKTESAKKLMAFLTERTRAEAVGGSDISIEEQVLQANPILEALGNAKTVLNNNSSRFGKFTKLLFNANEDGDGLHIIGSSIETYLLEKSRVIRQDPGERNYHIFYQLCSPGAQPVRDRLHLELPAAEQVHYLNQGITQIPGVSDSEEFAAVVRALNTLKFTSDEQDDIFRALAGVCHLGNVHFEPTDPEDRMSDVLIADASSGACLTASRLLGCDTDALRRRLTTRSIRIQGQVMHKPLNLDRAQLNRDAMCKALYVGLFDWVVSGINRELFDADEMGGEDVLWVGILDVFGFEVFENNSFEQFCINFCNERLQNYFNVHVIRSEQEEYQREAIFWTPVDVPDNQDVIDLIAGRGGIIALLDSACLMPQGNDELFTQSLFQYHKGHSRLQEARAMRTKRRKRGERRGSLSIINGFALRHYAGQVIYNASEFLFKNADSTHPDTKLLFASSTSQVAREIFDDPDDPVLMEAKSKSHRRRASAISPAEMLKAHQPRGPGVLKRAESFKRMGSFSRPQPLKRAESFKRGRSGSIATGPPRRRGSVSQRFDSLGSSFSRQLNELMDTLDSTEPFFVRCVKPNEEMRHSLFEREYVRPQLRCGGLIEALRIIKCGFPSRIAYQEVFERYGQLLQPQPVNLNKRDFCEAMLWAFGLERGQYQLGLTKVFFRPGQQEFLEQLNQTQPSDVSPQIIARVRELLIKKRIIRMKGAIRAYVRIWKRLRAKRARKRFHAAVGTASSLLRTVARAATRTLHKRAAIVLQAAMRAHLSVVRLASVRQLVPRIQRWYRHARVKRRLATELKKRIERRKAALTPEERARLAQLEGIVGKLAREVQAWIADVLGEHIVGEFFTALQDGKLLCRLVPAIDASRRVSYHKMAKIGSYLARDNISSFLRACKDMGLRDVELFVPDDLIERSNFKGVVNCLLALSRVGHKHGITPPPSVKLELERGFDLQEVVNAIEERERNPARSPKHHRRRSSLSRLGKIPVLAQQPGGPVAEGHSILESYIAPDASATATSPTSSTTSVPPARARDNSQYDAIVSLLQEHSLLQGDGGDPAAAVRALIADNAAMRAKLDSKGEDAAAAPAAPATPSAPATPAPPTPVAVPAAQDGSSSNWRDANHMYFFMTALACKLTHKGPGRKIPTGELYKRAMASKLPFQYYHAWVMKCIKGASKSSKSKKSPKGDRKAGSSKKKGSSGRRRRRRPSSKAKSRRPT